jgi:hypothetical protein
VGGGYRIRRQADDEALRLVHQVFLSAEQAPGVVVFAGMNHGNGCSQICSSVAEILAADPNCDRYAWLKQTFVRLFNPAYSLRPTAAASQTRSFVRDRSAPFASLSTPPAISGRFPVEQ